MINLYGKKLNKTIISKISQEKMVKQYVLVSNEQRQTLIDLIHSQGHSISRASKSVGIYYPTAKAINKVYIRENRI